MQKDTRDISADTTVTQDAQYGKEEEERGQQKEEREKAVSVESSTHSLSHVLNEVGCLKQFITDADPSPSRCSGMVNHVVSVIRIYRRMHTQRENITVQISTCHLLLHHASNRFTLLYVQQQQEEEEMENVDDDVQCCECKGH